MAREARFRGRRRKFYQRVSYAIDDADIVGMAEVLHCSVFKILEMDVEDFWHWRMVAAKRDRADTE